MFCPFLLLIVFTFDRLYSATMTIVAHKWNGRYAQEAGFFWIQIK